MRRRTIQSVLEVDQAPAGIVAAVSPLADSTVVEDEALVFFSTYGASELEAVQTVKCTRKADFFPEES